MGSSGGGMGPSVSSGSVGSGAGKGTGSYDLLNNGKSLDTSRQRYYRESGVRPGSGWDNDQSYQNWVNKIKNTSAEATKYEQDLAKYSVQTPWDYTPSEANVDYDALTKYDEYKGEWDTLEADRLAKLEELEKLYGSRSGDWKKAEGGYYNTRDFGDISQYTQDSIDHDRNRALAKDQSIYKGRVPYGMQVVDGRLVGSGMNQERIDRMNTAIAKARQASKQSYGTSGMAIGSQSMFNPQQISTSMAEQKDVTKAEEGVKTEYDPQGGTSVRQGQQKKRPMGSIASGGGTTLG